MRPILKSLCLVATLLFSIKATSQYITITLKANYSNAVSVYHDEPLLLTVSLTNQEAMENKRWNNAADRRLNEMGELLKENKISREDFEKEKEKLVAAKREVNSHTIGAAGKPWSSILTWKLINVNNGEFVPLKVRSMVNPSSDEIAVLNDKNFYQAFFGIDAEEMKKIPAGTYQVVVEIDNNKSEPTVMMIKNESMPALIAGSEEMLLKIGQYYWHAGDAMQGMIYADKLLQKNPVSVEGLSLKGDLQVHSNLFQPALESYSKALKEFYKQNPVHAEPPEYLLGMIEWLKNQK